MAFAPSYSTVFGFMNLITGIGGGLGPLAVGALAESLGGYAPALRTLLIIAPLAALAVLRVQPPHPQRRAPLAGPLAAGPCERRWRPKYRRSQLW